MAEDIRILLVDDEPVIQDVFKRLLKPHGYQLEVLSRGDIAVGELEKCPRFDLIVTDLMLPGKSGLEVLEAAKQYLPDVPVLLITAYGSVDNAVEAMKAGAFHYLTKPFHNDEVLLVINKALEKRRLMEENRKLRAELGQRYGFENIVGRSSAMQEVFDLIAQAAPSTATILIRGESGTGKELVARAIHHNSQRKNKSFIALNAGSIPGELLESQLFGHAKGAFTGAIGDKKGLFELADKGSFFLDEVGNINLEVQAKLLRVIQEKEFMPVGSTQTIKVDVRLICATNADLEQMIGEGKFREDLYYRLNVIEVQLPPLRERDGDILVLVDHFIRKFEMANQKRIEKVEPEFFSALEQYHWPGNVRELENVMERAVVLCRDGVIDVSLLPPSLTRRQEVAQATIPDLDSGLSFQDQIQIFEKTLITRALERSGGVQKKAASLLGLKTTTLSEMMKRYKLR